MAPSAKHLNTQELTDGLDAVLLSPRESGPLQLITRRPRSNERDVLREAELTLEDGLLGDDWRSRPSSDGPGGKAHPGRQLTIMNSRVISLIAQTVERWPLSGDQLFVDLDLSIDNLPSGTKLSVGTAVVEITPQAHTGCKKFVDRFGMDAHLFVNSEQGQRLRLRGVNAKVIKPGTILVGDLVRKIQGIE